MKIFFTGLISLAVYVFFFPSHNIVTRENVSKSLFANDHVIIKLKSIDKTVIAASNKENSSGYEEILRNIAGKLDIGIKRIKKLYPTDKVHFVELAKKYELETYYVLFFNGKYDIPKLCDKIEKNNSVDFSEPDFIGEAGAESSKYTRETMVPNDEFYGRQWGLHNDGTTSTSTGRPGKKGADMNVEKGWDIDKGSESVIVALLDSGVKLDHPDLAGRIWVNTKETRNGRDDDGNGMIDDINGWNFAYENNDVIDDAGHGTNIAGTVGAVTNNAFGYAGLDQRCKLMICKDLDDENLGQYSWWSSALYYAANNGAKVINMSEGGFDYSKTLDNAINFAYDAGCVIVASMMNKNNNDKYYPGGFKNVIAVGATDTDDGRCREFTWGGGSNWGKHICVVAPGNRIYGLDYKDNDNFDVYWSGTSQATAYVTGTASLLLSQDPNRSNKTIREIISKTAKDQVGDPREDTPGWDEYYGWGRVDLYAALNYGNNPTENKQDEKGQESKDENKGDKNLEQGSQPAKADEPNKPDVDDKRAKKVGR